MCRISAITPGRHGGWASTIPARVGAPAVNSGVQLGWVHSLCGAAAASRSCSACRGSAAGFLRHAAARCWKPSDRGSVAAGCAQRGLFHFGLHVGHGHALPCVNNPAPVESPSCWERSLLDGRASALAGQGLDRSPGIRAWVRANHSAGAGAVSVAAVFLHGGLHKKWFFNAIFVQNCSKCVSGRKSVPA